MSEDRHPDPVEETEAETAAETRLVWQLFWEEVPDQLQALDLHLQHLRDEPTELETIRELEREFHTLKGGARMAQLSAMADVSHDAESLLSRLTHTKQVGDADIETLQKAVDALHAFADKYSHAPVPPAVAAVEVENKAVQAVAPAEDSKPVDISRDMPPPLADSWARMRIGSDEFGSLLERMLAEQAESLPDISILDSTLRQPVAAPANVETALNPNSQESIRLSAGFVDGLVDRAVGLNLQQVRMAEHFSDMGLDVEELIRTVARLRQQIRALEVESEMQIHDGRSKHKASPVSGKEGFDPLEMDQYAEIQRISRSLAESLNDLVNLEADLASQVRKGEQLLQTDMRTTRQLQQDLLSTRLVALTVLVPRLRRLTRQTAAELDKQVVLEVQGEECELDRHLLQHMTAPLEHLIRNAIAHGIEPPDEREQQGKPRSGKITLHVSRDDAEIVIRFRDDGRGLDRQRIRQRALEQGLVMAGQALSDSDMDRLILRPGFTTATAVSQIAGRGIGMDVVYSELKSLGGSLQVQSDAGKGAEFTMRLPFTLVVNPVLLVEAQAQVYALPMGGIQGLARLTGQQIQEALQASAASVEYAGQLYHLRPLAEVLGAPGNMEYPADERFPVVFVQSQGHALAWVIERIRGRREVVLQPLGVLFKACRLYSAATVAPDGRVFLMPDMAELARRVLDKVSLPEGEAVEPAVAPEEPAGPPRVMVVDDSITVRRVTEKFLDSQQYIVGTAKDGMEALEKIAEFLPDVLLLDIEMPRMDGFELLGHLRRDPQWARLPVIMISSRTAQKHREHAASVGATGFLGKPYQNDVLLGALRDVLESGHEPDETQEWGEMTV
jgi:chemosensory pili system protein ChpA (sensor histidine kinase/response regulator)